VGLIESVGLLRVGIAEAEALLQKLDSVKVINSVAFVDKTYPAFIPGHLPTLQHLID
jgi:hypothetical protein